MSAVFWVVFAAMLVERLWELRISKRRTASLLAAGGRVHALGRIGLLLGTLHGSWLIAIAAEVLVLRRAFDPTVAAISFVILLIASALRFSSMRALGDRWTIHVVSVPGAPLVERGPYAYVRHPNYFGVMLEMPALPLMHGAWITALVWGVLNVWFLAYKISLEERVLATDETSSPAYRQLPRFLPYRRPASTTL